MRARRAAGWVGIGVAIAAVLLLGALLILTRTDWGRDQVRRFALDRIDGAIDGEIEIGRIGGDLLRRVRIIDVVIRDRQGRLFLEADTLEARLAVRALLRQRIELADVRVVRAVVVLDKPPGEEWNYVRIFRIDPETVEPTRPGWGDWVALSDVTLVDSRLTVRTEWRPPADLTPAEREAALRKALASETREHVIAVPGGYQNVMDFRALDAELPRVLVAHPDTAGIPIEVARLGGLIRPFSPPAVRVVDLAGSFRILRDSLFMSGVRAVLPGSRLSGGGIYALDKGDLLLHARGDPVEFADLRWLYPPLPERGGGTMLMMLELGAVVSRVVVRDMDVAVDGGTVAGGFDLTTGDTLRFGETDLSFARVRTALLERFVDFEFPRRGRLTGRLALQGLPRELSVAGDVRFDDDVGAASRVIAEGVLGIEPDLRFRGLRMRFAPLQAELARVLVPQLPLRGTAEGTALLTGSLASLQLEADLALRDPRHGLSRLRAAGGLDTRDELRLRDMVVRVDPLRLDLLRDEMPELPAGATATGRAWLDGVPARALRVDADIVIHDPASGMSGIGATGGLVFGDEVRFDALRVRADPVRVDLLRGWAPELPPGGTLLGTVRLHGAPARFLDVDGRLAHHHDELGVSRVQAAGGIGLAGPVTFRDLDLVLEPLHLALVRAFAPDLPLGGTLAGTATLNGSPATRIAVRGDLVHDEAGERSHVVGRADVATGPGGRAAVDVRLQPLSLAVAGRFVPAAGLRGTVAGRLEARGELGDIRLDTELRTRDGGAIRGIGTLDLAAAEPGYDLDVRLRDFDLAAVTWRAPAETDLTGAVMARGRGLEPATMRATIAADLTDSVIDDVSADIVRVRLGIEAGLARVDSSIVRLGGAEAVLDGSFGLVAGRHGVLAYTVAVDSLHAFAPWLPGADTAVARPIRRVPPALALSPTPPGLPAPVLTDQAAADTAGAGGAPPPRHFVAADGARVTITTTRVQRTIEREPEAQRAALADPAVAEMLAQAQPSADPAAEPHREPDPPLLAPALPADSLAGSLQAAGTLRGNLARFDIDGRAEVDELIYRGTFVGSGAAEYALADVGTTSPDIVVDAGLRDVRTAELDFHSIAARGRYRGVRGEGEGEVVVAAHGTDDTEYRVDAEFTLSLARSELRLADLLLRFDTITWRTAQPGVVSWGGGGMEFANIELLSDDGGRVSLDGRLPVDGTGDLTVVVEELEIAQVAALLQLEDDVRGRLTMDARVQGTLADPRMTGTARLAAARLDGDEVPDVRGSFRYAALELTADVELLHDGRQIAVAEARLPVDLSLVPDIAPRLLGGELAIDVRSDSLPVEAIPGLTDQVDDVRGRVRGDMTVRGTFAEPVFTGDIDVDLGSIRVIPLEVRFEDVAGRLTLDGTTLRVDSLVAWSGGPIRVTGEIGVVTAAQPAFALQLEAREALIMDTDDASLVVDADITVGGTLQAIEVAGDVRTRNGVIYIPELRELGEADVVSLHAPATYERIETAFIEERLALERRRPLLDRLRLDVGVHIDRDVWLRSTEANVEIYTPREVGPLRIRMEGAAGLAVDGTINTDRGEYEFMGRRFDLTRGALTFFGGRDINPILQIAAEHEVRLPGREAFAIRVLLGGTVRNLEITLESTAQPPIAHTELLSYLAFGRDAASLLHRQGSALSGQGSQAGELAGNVAGMATHQLATVAMDVLLGDLEAELMRELRVDVFRITPADLPPDMFTGSYADVLRATEVEAGRYVSPRLFVAGQITTGLVRPGVRVEYRTPLGVQWVSSWKPQWLPAEPTLTERDPRRAAVLGSFVFREWRF
jgi:hypothetical protein